MLCYRLFTQACGQGKSVLVSLPSGRLQKKWLLLTDDLTDVGSSAVVCPNDTIGLSYVKEGKQGFKREVSATTHSSLERHGIMAKRCCLVQSTDRVLPINISQEALAVPLPECAPAEASSTRPFLQRSPTDQIDFCGRTSGPLILDF